MKKLLIVFILSTLSLFAISSNDPTSNSNSNTLKGKVLDMKTNEALAGVQVSILNTDYKTYTDLDGNFYFKNLPNEKHEIIFSLISYNNSLCEINTDEKTIDVKLISIK